MARQRANTVVDRDLGWQRLKDVSRVLRSQDAYAKVGVLAGAPLPEGAPPSFTMASLAAVHEFGTEDGHIPARPFIRAGIDKARPELFAAAKKLAGGIYDGKMEPERALNILGAMGASAIRKYVTQGDQVPPPNAPATIRAKLRKGKWRGRAPVDAQKLIRTLIDTGRMIQSVTWQVSLTGHVGSKRALDVVTEPAVAP